jgi:hypothetical protein
MTGHNDSTSKQIHDRSQATKIQQANKYMTDQRPQRFNKNTNTWPITGNNYSPVNIIYLSASGIVVACDRSCICVPFESLLPEIRHVFVCLLNRCGLLSVMHLNTWQITGPQATTIPLAVKCMTDHRPQGFNKHRNTVVACGPVICHVFVCLLNLFASDLSYMCVFVESLWPVNGHVLVNSCCLWTVMYLSQIHDRSQAHRPQRFH